ncbi:RND superfamily putative drug exporter [Ureibacillus xyleni]|uniref:RND superfamily putative drug exporter n=1 Tax=Ureibacillus xyleni TaxID=614648 RepID=A0A285TB95_9BACL|nr:MMPL family transporter [Ureibacillus xyleni]SOC18313.1 RND superfamily putative drug exporter [Ureibacillus xyleni]
MLKFSQLVTKHVKFIITIWVILFVTLAFFAIQLPQKLEGDGFSVDGDHNKVMIELSKTFDLPEKSIIVLFEKKSNTEIEEILSNLKEVKEIHSVTSPIENNQLHKDDYSYAILNFGKEVDDYNSIVEKIREILVDEKGVSITGEPVISKDINVASQKDLASAEAIGLPIAIIVLLLAFGTIMASLLPIIIGAVSVVTALGTLTLLGSSFNLSIFILNIVPMLGLALSIDFALLFINRYREERTHSSIEDSVRVTIQTAGRSIIFSAVCVMIGLGAMAVIQVEIFQNIALGGTIAVFLAVLSGITLLPSLLIVLGDRLNKGRILRVKPVATYWRTFAGFVMKHPVSIIIVSLVILGVGMVPLRDMELNIPSADSLPTSYESRQAYDQLQETFDYGKDASVILLAERKEGWEDEEALQQIFDIQQKLLEDPLVTKVENIFTTAGVESVEMWQIAQQNPQTAEMLKTVKENFIQDNQMFLTLTLDAESTSTEAQDWVREWKDKDLGVDFALAGHPKFNQEIFDEISNKIFIAVAIILVTTFIILMIAFRSLLIPLKAILMNIIGLGSAFGILVYLFQYGHLGLDESTIALIIPVIVFCLVFGLSMDYEVFLISRIQEEYQKGVSNTKATVDGLVSTSKIITSAALIMIVITGAFAFTDVLPVKQIGVGIAIAVAIDATIIRLMLVPSLMKLLGDWNWWIPFIKNKRQ